MRSKPSVTCPAVLVGTPQQTVKIKRGGVGRQSGSGPSGYKTNPAYMLARALADRPGVNIMVKKRQEERVREKARPVKLLGWD